MLGPTLPLDIDATLEGRNLANQMRLDYPGEEYPLTEVRALHWLQDLVDSGVVRVPAGSNLRAEVERVYAAARALWPMCSAIGH